MAKIKISYTAPGADVTTADLDGAPISFFGTAKSGEATVTVSAGTHRVHYTIEGLPNTSYTVKVDEKSVTDTIGPTGIAAGSIPFTVPSAATKAAIGLAAAAAAAGAAAAVRARGRKKRAAKKAPAKKAPAKKKSAKAAAKRSSKKRRPSPRKTSSKRTSSKKGGRR